MVNKTKSIKEYESMTLGELRSEAKKVALDGYMELPKRELIIEILKKQTSNDGFVFVEGILEIQKDGSHGILRTDGLLPGDNDVYISGSQMKKFSLRTGDEVAGPARLPKEKEKYLSLLRVDTVYGKPAAKAANRPQFMKMTPIFPNKQIKLETKPEVISTRIIDLLSPIGFGQRSMVVSPPKAGKTWLLKDIADGIATNNPKAKLIVVLVGERPEEVTDMKRFVKGEVYASNFDELPEHNCRVAEMALQKAMCMVEWGEDVIILMDSITRLARAYNITMPTSGKTLSGGFDPVALYPPKRFFGAARNFEEGGSLTIIATALVETGSRMDDLVYEEFKGTGNMELHLDRSLANKRIYPSIDVTKSGTRNEELLLGKDVLNHSWRIRRMLELLDQNENPTEVLVSQLKKTKSNEEFLATLHEA
ncbi:transcription termination factor Rho [Candidatus Dojkabacteria bacterium]|uniref:Transcription termination factor Rho n=1 Tax=Candidatus Dojkabacteria bacterium TaxID=2099670 RepID=A0A847VC67_9BACT|nr:transcription termination factor Rho [Candidatus Dojkabacteria bacterium]